MAIASSAGAPPPVWLDTLGKIAGVILGIELIVVLLIVCGLMVGLVLALRWLNMHIVPVLQENAPKAQRVMQVAEQNTDRVVSGVAEFYGRRQAVRTGLRVLLFGRQSAERIHEESLIEVATDLDLMETEVPDNADAATTGAPRGGGHQRQRAGFAPVQPPTPLPAQRDDDDRNGYHAPENGYRRTAGNAG